MDYFNHKKANLDCRQQILACLKLQMLAALASSDQRQRPRPCKNNNHSLEVLRRIHQVEVYLVDQVNLDNCPDFKSNLVYLEIITNNKLLDRRN